MYNIVWYGKHNIVVKEHFRDTRGGGGVKKKKEKEKERRKLKNRICW